MSRHSYRAIGSSAATALILLAHTSPSLAFDYAEHYAITLQSFRQACAELSGSAEISELANRMCKSNAVASCLAHMTALAGDYTARPNELEHAKDSGILARDGTNCQNILQVLADDERNSEAERNERTNELPEFASHLGCMAAGHMKGSVDAGKADVDPVLIDGWFDRKWRWIKLAADNAEHFQPTSHEQFTTYRAHASATANIEPQSGAAYHAFSMHFLEDSFAAGHIGLDRSNTDFGAWGARQDYGHAYHDDLNWAGQYLRNSAGEVWYSYGDKNLCAPTLYVDVSKWTTTGSSEQWLEAVLRIVGSAYRFLGVEQDSVRMPDGGRLIAANLAKEMDVLATTAPGRGAVASLPMKRPLWAFCSYFVFCNKLELVLINTEHDLWRGKSFEECKPLLTDESSGLSIHGCFDTRQHVLEAANRAQRAFLQSLPDENAGRSARPDSVGELFPSSYAPIDFTDSERGLNSDPLILRSKPFQPVDDFELLANSAWGFDVVREQSSYGKLNDWSFDFSLQGRLGTQPVTVRGSVVTIHDSHWSLFDQLEAGYDFARITEPKFRLLSLAPEMHVGIDSIFRGADARNVYAGVGFGIESDLGRYVLQVRFARDVHWNDQMNREWASRISFGLKIPSMDLAP